MMASSTFALRSPKALTAAIPTEIVVWSGREPMCTTNRTGPTPVDG
jgi:hypothetical protein